MGIEILVSAGMIEETMFIFKERMRGVRLNFQAPWQSHSQGCGAGPETEEILVGDLMGHPHMHSYMLGTQKKKIDRLPFAAQSRHANMLNPFALKRHAPSSLLQLPNTCVHC